MNYEQEITKKCCNTCEFNFGNVCAGYGTRTDNKKIHMVPILMK